MSQPVLSPEKNEIERLNGIVRSQIDALNHWRKAYDAARREAAQECECMAAELAESYGNQSCGHAVGVETVAVLIQRRFGLASRWVSGTAKAEVFTAVTEVVAEHYLDLAEAAGLTVVRHGGNQEKNAALRRVIVQAFAGVIDA